jgi:N-acetylmuramic acid 6-phosphate etherase
MAGPGPVTERRDARHADLDLRSTLELVELINDEDALVAPAVREVAGPLAAAIDGVVERLGRGGRLLYAGAGTSGHLGAVDAAECCATFGLDEGLVVAYVAADAAAEDDEAVGAAALSGARADDAVVVVSASGSTPYALGAARAAADAGALVVAVAGVPGSPLAALAELAVVPVTGPEVIAGSTRLKAGTAQKLVLNTISTVSMIRLGRTYGNLMVDVVAANTKLRGRARRAVELATGRNGDEVDAALQAAGGDAKVAIVALLTGRPAEEARELLTEADGHVRRALEDA